MLKDEWFIYTHDNYKRLFVTREPKVKSESFSPCNMTPDDVDYEMSFGKSKKILEICGMNQQSFEYFIEKYGDSYEYLSFFKCQLISDFSPLSKLKNLQCVDIYWNTRATQFWDMSKNTSLQCIIISNAKRLTYELPLLNTAKELREVFVSGDIFNGYPMKNLSAFDGITSLENIVLQNIKLEEHSFDVLDSLPKLETFDFNAGMLKTEEIAYLCARYPNLKGQSLCAYNTADAILNDVRVCGYRKPGLDLPKQQKRLDKYIAEFNALVEKYKLEIDGKEKSELSE